MKRQIRSLELGDYVKVSWFDASDFQGPLVKQKKPLIEWAHWQTAHQTLAEFQSLPWEEADGFAVICGTKLCNGLFLGAIDFDVKNVSEEARERGKRTLKQLLTTQIEQTPSGGQHWIYYCQTSPEPSASIMTDAA